MVGAVFCCILSRNASYILRFQLMMISYQCLRCLCHDLYATVLGELINLVCCGCELSDSKLDRCQISSPYITVLWLTSLIT